MIGKSLVVPEMLVEENLSSGINALVVIRLKRLEIEKREAKWGNTFFKRGWDAIKIRNSISPRVGREYREIIYIF
ncbi:MAG: hypothetical protein R6U21_04735 [Thermoplasmatota archaeon]